MTSKDVERNNGSPSQDKQRSNEASPPSGRRNQFHYRATTRSVEIKADFTDAMAEFFGQLLTGLVRPAITGRPVAKTGVAPVIEAPARLAFPDGNGSPEAPSGTVGQEPVTAGSNGSQLSGDLQEIFTFIDGQLTFDRSELKAKSQRDHVKRMVYIYLLAKGATERSEINTLLGETGLYDSNARTFLANDSYIRRTSDGLLELTSEGREQARMYAAEAVDPNIPSTWSSQRRSSRKPRGKQSATNRKDNGDSQDASPKRARNSGRGRPRLADTVRPWVTALDGAGIKKEVVHEAMKDESLAYKGLVGLWAIHKVTSQMDAITVGQLARFLEDAFGVQVRKNNLERALKGLRNQSPDLVLKGDGTRFKASPSTISHVEGRLQKKGDS